MDAETAKLLVALALILSCGLAVARSVDLPKTERPARAPKRKERPAPLRLSGAAPPADTLAAALPIAVPSTGSTRPRIFTGEPMNADPDPGAGRRALRLVGGLTLMAAVGAVGILAFVRAMVVVFERLGG